MRGRRAVSGAGGRRREAALERATARRCMLRPAHRRIASSTAPARAHAARSTVVGATRPRTFPARFALFTARRLPQPRWHRARGRTPIIGMRGPGSRLHRRRARTAGRRRHAHVTIESRRLTVRLHSGDDDITYHPTFAARIGRIEAARAFSAGRSALAGPARAARIEMRTACGERTARALARMIHAAQNVSCRCVQRTAPVCGSRSNTAVERRVGNAPVVSVWNSQ